MVLGADTRHAIILGAQNGLTVRKIQTDLEKQGKKVSRGAIHNIATKKKDPRGRKRKSILNGKRKSAGRPSKWLLRIFVYQNPNFHYRKP